MRDNAPDSGDRLSHEDRVALARRFRNHGEHIYGVNNHNSSPLYAFLSMQVAGDPDVLALAVQADRATQIPNLLFAAVHYLLMGDLAAPLAAYYPDCTDSPCPITEVYPAFRAYCLAHADTIRQLVTTRRVQTNEVRRCAPLLLAAETLSQQLNGQPLAWVEIGASAGLLMQWDRYGYAFRDEAGNNLQAGDAASPVQITSELRGALYPPIPTRMPTVAWRVGLDINPIDPRDEDATRWLRALIWPEHCDRRELLDAALAVAREHPPRIIAGNAMDTLPAALDEAPAEAALCVYHSYALNQMPATVRESILKQFVAYARQHPQRPLYRISQEWYGDQETPQLELFTYRADEGERELLATCESHGRWIEWRRTQN